MKKKVKFNYTKDFYEKDEEYFEMLEEKLSKKCWFKDYYDAVLNYSDTKSKILECGCGTGITTFHLHKFRQDIIGIDFSNKFIRKAKTRGKYFFTMDVTKLRFRKEKFDLVCFADLIEHVPDLNKALDEMDRVLKKGGFLIIQAPNLFTNLFSYNYKKSLRNILRKISHLLADIKNSRLATIEEYGLDIIEGDRDAYNLISPIWLIKTLKNRGYKIKYMTTYSLFFKANMLLKLGFSIISRLPIIKYLGGRIILIAQKS